MTIAANLKVKGIVTREGAEWLIACPAFRFTVQGGTLAEARREFRIVMADLLEEWEASGELATVMQLAQSDPSASLVPAAKVEEYELPLPLHLLTHAKPKARKTA